jgi:predicted membrane protein
MDTQKQRFQSHKKEFMNSNHFNHRQRPFNHYRNVPKSRGYGLFGFGVILAVAGVLLLLSQIGVLGAGFNTAFISWPMILVVFGIMSFFIRHYGKGSVLLLIGAFFLMPYLKEGYPVAFGWVPEHFTRYWWPLILVILGVVVITITISKRSILKKFNAKIDKEHKTEHEDIANDGFFERRVVLGGSDLLILDPVFHGCRLDVSFGGIELDLRKTTLPEGKTIIDLKCNFGGITIFVPEGWNIETCVNVDLSGVTDDRRNKSINPDSNSLLLITGSCRFSGIEIRN